jgi:YesN/AraC family two-component response regulator
VVFYSLLEKKNHGSFLNLDYLTKPIGTLELARAIERQGIPRDCIDKRVILIVDDDPQLLDLHARIVQANVQDCRVMQAHNGREALEIMEVELPDLVLLDLMMPEIDGFGVIEEMRNHESTRTIPIIVITGQVLTCQEMDRLQQGIAAVLGIGLFSVEEVLSQIESALCTNKHLGCQAKQVVRQAMAYIHEHYDEPVTREDLATYVSVSPRYLTRCFHEETGLTPITYLNRYRINQAKELLERGDSTITEVAFNVGFSNSNYFGRVFRREVGASPSTYQHGARIE